MSQPSIVGSRLLGVVGRTLTPEVAVRYASAFAALAPDGSIVVTRDGRASGEMLVDAIHAGLQAVGRNTIDAGVAATPTTGLLVREYRAAGGIQVSADHQPAEYNGLMLLSAEGRLLSDRPGEMVLAQYRTGRIDWVSQAKRGVTRVCPDTKSGHLRAVLDTVDAARIRNRGFSVLLDSNHGAGSILGRRLLKELGCELTLLGQQRNGQFAHAPLPTAGELASVLSAVTDAGADVGFCQDPDAHRLAVIDHTGRFLGEEYTLAMCVDHVLRARRGPIVTNCSTSRMSEDLARRYGVGFRRSAVGEAYLVDAMLEVDAVFGGEGSGGTIDPRVGLVCDSFVGMAQLLDAMAAREMGIDELADELPHWEIVKMEVALPREKVPAVLDALQRHFIDAAGDRLDGLRLDWPDAWLLVRPSNTQPTLRTAAEAKTAGEARRLCREAIAVVQKTGG